MCGDLDSQSLNSTGQLLSDLTCLQIWWELRRPADHARWPSAARRLSHLTPAFPTCSPKTQCCPALKRWSSSESQKAEIVLMLKLLNWQELIAAPATLPAKVVWFTCPGHLQINSTPTTIFPKKKKEKDVTSQIETRYIKQIAWNSASGFGFLSANRNC